MALRRRDGFKGQRLIVIPESIRRILIENPVTNSLYLSDIGYYPKASQHYCERPRGAAEDILIYCISGEGWITVKQETFRLTSNQFFIIPAGVPHKYWADDSNPWSIYWLHFCGEKSSVFSSMYLRVGDITAVANNRIEDRLSIFEEIYQNLNLGYSIETLEYVSMCLWHLLASFRYINQFREIKNMGNRNVVQQAIVYMRDHVCEKLTLEDICNEVKYSSSQFSLLFTGTTGHSPMDYFNQLKIQRACQYLDLTNLKVKEISYMLGFRDQFYFSKVFKKYMETTPVEYKKRMESGDWKENV